jgi:uncharacterized protein YutE (UPF0331/DUF86 family)
VSPSKVRAATVLHKAAQIDAMLAGIAALRLQSFAAFAGDPRDVAAAESYVRRALEALLDLGRHILAKALGEGALEYKQVAASLQRCGVLDEASGALMLEMAGYRNRLVHFYDEVTSAELYEICTQRLDDVRGVRDAMLRWLGEHSELVDGRL